MAKATAIPERMKALRQRAGRSQEWAAEQVGVTQPTYSKMESGTAPITLATLSRIARAYGGTVSELFPAYTPSEDEREIILHAHTEAATTRAALDLAS